MYLFFVRHFNDIDHLTPVAWKMKKDDHPVAVYCMNPRYDYRSDYRLLFLKNQGVTVDYLHNKFDRHRGMFHELLNSAVQRSYASQRRFGVDGQGPTFYKRLLGYIAGQAGLLSYKLIRLGYYDIRWARSILKKSGARAICFDHVMPGLHVVGRLLKAAKEMSIPSFSLPHGIHLYTNEATKPKSTDARRFAKFNGFEYIIVPNQLRKHFLVRSGVLGEKIFVLGSARYCDEWLAQNKKIIPRVIDPPKRNGQKLKVVFMPSKPQCKVDLDRLKATCSILAGI